MTLNSQQYANLSDHSYGRNLDGAKVDLKPLVGKSVEIEGVEYKILAHADKPSGYQGTIYQRVDNGEIVAAHRGTEFGREPIKDGLLADGGMVFARLNSQAADAIDLTRHAIALARRNEGGYQPAPEVTVTGHSLGGTLAQITAHHFDLRGETFNAYGAASLGYRIPEGGNRVLNHVMAADVVSSASPHYGQVRVYAKPGEIAQLQTSGYSNSRIVDALIADNPIAASLNTSHMMHNFLNVDGDGKRDVSALGDTSARARANDNERMIQDYRGDVRALRTGASLGGDAVDIIRHGPLRAPGRAVERASEALQPDLPAGEPARREGSNPGVPRPSQSVPQPAASTGSRNLSEHDLRRPDHARHGQYETLRDQIGAAYAQAGIVRSEEQLDRAAAAVSLDMQKYGLIRADKVYLTLDTQGAIGPDSGLAVQQGQYPLILRSMTANDALQQSPEQNFQQLQQVAAQQTAEQQRQVAAVQQGPALA